MTVSYMCDWNMGEEDGGVVIHMPFLRFVAA